MRRAVVVLGGNAFVTPGQRLTMDGQMQFAHEAMLQLEPLLNDDIQLLISHGNGPQVGHILIRVEESLGKAYSIPLEVCVAESEGELGYVLELALHNVHEDLQRKRPIAALLTQVVVAADDPAFRNPTKPIGVFYSQSQAEELRQRGFAVVRMPGVGIGVLFHRLCRCEVLELDVIRQLMASGTLVIAAGGGGIPVVREGGKLRGVEAVIDKDLTAALLADQLDAELLLILTDVPCAYRDFGSANQEPIGRIIGDEAQSTHCRRTLCSGQYATENGSRRSVCRPSRASSHHLQFVVAACRTCRGTGWHNSRIQTQIVPDSHSRELIMAETFNCLIMGAAGRDFHNFQTFFRDRPSFRVCAFTATQIPYIESRAFPRSLAGPNYTSDIPIYSGIAVTRADRTV